MRAKGLLLLVAASAAWSAAAIDEQAVEVGYWTSPDGMELYLAAAAPAESGGPRLYYFNNDTSRLCYTFSVAGSWRLDEATGVMQSTDGRGSLGQSIQGPDELGTGSGREPVEAAITSYQSAFAERLHALAAQGVKGISAPAYAVEAFTAAGREAVKWTAHATARLQGREANIRQHEVFVEVLPGWVLALETQDAVAREAIESLGTAAAPDCYWPFIREHFPTVPTP